MESPLKNGRREKDERFKTFLEWAGAHEASAPTVVPETSNLAEAAKLAQHVYARLLMNTEAGAETHTITDKGRFVQRFDPTSAHVNLNIMKNISKPPKDNIAPQ